LLFRQATPAPFKFFHNGVVIIFLRNCFCNTFPNPFIFFLRFFCEEFFLKNKIIFKIGSVQNIGKDILDKPYISLCVDKYSITNVQCFIQPSGTGIASSLNKGYWVKIVGRCKGKFMNVLMEDCLVEKISPPKKGKK